MKPERKIQILRHIQYSTCLDQPATPLALGLTETEFLELADEGLLEYCITGESDVILKDHHVQGITDLGKGAIANAAQDPIRISIHEPPKSVVEQIAQWLEPKLWDIAKILLAGLLGYWLGQK